MKGLLLKDWFVAKKTCALLLLASVLMLGMGAILPDFSLFLQLYPTLLCSMIPYSLLAQDERSHWLQYSAALPYTRAQIVSAKYLVGLIAQGVVLAVTAVIQVVTQHFTPAALAIPLSIQAGCALSSSLTLPLGFRYGTEKGRALNAILIGAFSGVSVLFPSIGGFVPDILREGLTPFLLLTVCSLLVYLLSWRLSIHLFRKREIF